MRVEPYGVGSILHVVKRGARGIDIVRDNGDKWRFLKMLFLLNDAHFDKNWVYDHDAVTKNFHRPDSWPEREPLVHILAYTLMPNHFHLLLEEINEGGVSQFMKRLGQSMTNHANEKYKEKGSLFQGAYRSRTIDNDEYLKYAALYIMAKNTLELYPGGGLQAAQKDFDSAWKWATTYQFSSLADLCGVRGVSPILAKNRISELFEDIDPRTFSEDMIKSSRYLNKEKELELY